MHLVRLLSPDRHNLYIAGSIQRWILAFAPHRHLSAQSIWQHGQKHTQIWILTLLHTEHCTCSLAVWLRAHGAGFSHLHQTDSTAMLLQFSSMAESKHCTIAEKTVQGPQHCIMLRWQCCCPTSTAHMRGECQELTFTAWLKAPLFHNRSKSSLAALLPPQVTMFVDWKVQAWLLIELCVRDLSETNLELWQLHNRLV